MKILLLGRKKHQNTIETIGKVLELENVGSEFVFFDDCAEGDLTAKLRGADLYMIFPESLAKGCLGDEPDCSVCVFESVAAGFLISNKGRMLIFTRTPEMLSSIFKGEPSVSSIGEALAYFRRERKVYENSRLLHEARRKISAAHLSFSSSGLVQAVDYGMYPETQAFLKAGFSTETEDKNGVPLLSIAVRNGDMEITRLLMSYDASLNIIARDRITSPLMDAVTAGNAEIARVLIEAGADLNYRNRNGQTALVVAIGARMLEIAELLIDSGADLLIKDSLGMTAAEYAKLFSMTALNDKLGIPENK